MCFKILKFFLRQVRLFPVHSTLDVLLFSANYKPFEIRVFTDEFEEQTNEDGTSSTDVPQIGFKIFYNQLPC
jgi:hypothetical protein